jgi:hypothetical protein
MCPGYFIQTNESPDDQYLNVTQAGAVAAQKKTFSPVLSALHAGGAGMR